MVNKLANKWVWIYIPIDWSPLLLLGVINFPIDIFSARQRGIPAYRILPIYDAEPFTIYPLVN